MINFIFFFFFQAEDGIRDLYVTGVQTCALPICRLQEAKAHRPLERLRHRDRRRVLRQAADRDAGERYGLRDDGRRRRCRGRRRLGRRRGIVGEHRRRGNTGREQDKEKECEALHDVVIPRGKMRGSSVMIPSILLSARTFASAASLTVQTYTAAPARWHASTAAGVTTAQFSVAALAPAARSQAGRRRGKSARSTARPGRTAGRRIRRPEMPWRSSGYVNERGKPGSSAAKPARTAIEHELTKLRPRSSCRRSASTTSAPRPPSFTSTWTARPRPAASARPWSSEGDP